MVGPAIERYGLDADPSLDPAQWAINIQEIFSKSHDPEYVLKQPRHYIPVFVLHMFCKPAQSKSWTGLDKERKADLLRLISAQRKLTSSCPSWQLVSKENHLSEDDSFLIYHVESRKFDKLHWAECFKYENPYQKYFEKFTTQDLANDKWTFRKFDALQKVDRQILAGLCSNSWRIYEAMNDKRAKSEESITLKRSDIWELRKSLFLLTFLRNRDRNTHMIQNFPNMDEAREKRKKFMSEQGLSHPRDLWLHNVETILDTPHHQIGHSPKMFDFDREDYRANARERFLVFWEAGQNDEFILTDNSFGAYEGCSLGSKHLMNINMKPSDLSKRLYTRDFMWHQIFVMSPKLVIALCHGTLINPKLARSQRGRYGLRPSVLDKLPHPLPDNYYKDLHIEECRFIKSEWEIPEELEDLFGRPAERGRYVAGLDSKLSSDIEFKVSTLSTAQVSLVNMILLSNQSSLTKVDSIVYRNPAAICRAIDDFENHEWSCYTDETQNSYKPFKKKILGQFNKTGSGSNSPLQSPGIESSKSALASGTTTPKTEEKSAKVSKPVKTPEVAETKKQSTIPDNNAFFLDDDDKEPERRREIVEKNLSDKLTKPSVPEEIAEKIVKNNPVPGNPPNTTAKIPAQENPTIPNGSEINTTAGHSTKSTSEFKPTTIQSDPQMSSSSDDESEESEEESDSSDDSSSDEATARISSDDERPSRHNNANQIPYNRARSEKRDQEREERPPFVTTQSDDKLKRSKSKGAVNRPELRSIKTDYVGRRVDNAAQIQLEKEREMFKLEVLERDRELSRIEKEKELLKYEKDRLEQRKMESERQERQILERERQDLEAAKREFAREKEELARTQMQLNVLGRLEKEKEAALVAKLESERKALKLEKLALVEKERRIEKMRKRELAEQQAREREREMNERKEHAERELDFERQRRYRESQEDRKRNLRHALPDHSDVSDDWDTRDRVHASRKALANHSPSSEPVAAAQLVRYVQDMTPPSSSHSHPENQMIDRMYDSLSSQSPPSPQLPYDYPPSPPRPAETMQYSGRTNSNPRRISKVPMPGFESPPSSGYPSYPSSPLDSPRYPDLASYQAPKKEPRKERKVRHFEQPGPLPPLDDIPQLKKYREIVLGELEDNGSPYPKPSNRRDEARNRNNEYDNPYNRHDVPDHAMVPYGRPDRRRSEAPGLVRRKTSLENVRPKPRRFNHTRNDSRG